MTESTKTSATDMPDSGWVDRVEPAYLRPYLKLARLDRPTGIWLLFFPCLWGLALASPGFPDPVLVLLFAIGAILMRSAGCVFNDIVDRDFDARVARTRDRPLAAGTLSPTEAVRFLVVLLLAGLVVLLCFNHFTVLLGIASLGLVFLYPFAKRFTDWPQAVLGLTFNWGALMGWTAVTGEISLAACALYAGAFFWTLAYDTIYAHQDKADDLLIGVKSTAIRLGSRTKPFLFVFYGSALFFFAASGALAGLGWLFYAGLGLLAAQLVWQVVSLKLDAPADCLAKFQSNQWAGLILAFAILGGRLLTSLP
ncbi:MAG: 4-hydroxybenzoate octaprenyltransferase [Alphaproteobacteria bacterium]|nr:4-hydroxybenzoate octaprenyltransferase [Alphaproteobacteria bacterium]